MRWKIPKNKSSEEFERALLGTILANKNAFDKIKGLIVSDDFYEKKNKIVFQAIDDIVEKGFVVEMAPIIKELKETDRLGVIGGEEYLNILLSFSGIKSNLQKFAEGIVEKSRMRQVAREINSIQAALKEQNLSADELLDRVETDIISSTRNGSNSDFRSAKEVVVDVIDEMNKKLAGEITSGMPSGYKELDKILGGFHKGDLFVLAARPSMGKTALALNIAANVARDKTVAFFSVEMASSQLINRIIGFTAYLESHKISDPRLMTQTDKQKYSSATNKIKNMKLYMDDSPGIKINELVWKARRLKKNIGIDMIIIDYLQLLSAGGKTDNRQAEVSLISRTLKKLARELEVPVIALSQLSRKVEQRESKIPMMSDIRESGAIEQDADIIGFVYREDYYNNNKEEVSQEHQLTKIIIGKHRNGPTGVANLSFDAKCGLFLDAVKKEFN